MTMLRRVVATPLHLSTGLALAMLMVAVVEVAQVSWAANRVRLRAEEMLIRSAAEQLAFEATVGPPGTRTVTLCANLSLTAAPQGSGQTLEVMALRNGEPRVRYLCEMLPGGSPLALAFPLALQADPLPLAPAVATAERLADQPWLRREPAIALSRLVAGTDLPDFMLVPMADGVVRPAPTLHGFLRLDGHLWIDRGGSPLVVELKEDLTLVIRGNLYVGRPVIIRGRGRLTLVVEAGSALRFRDLDGDGRWSVGDVLIDTEVREHGGPIEGGGAVYLGLPGDSEQGSIDLDASLVVAGEIHVLAPEVKIQGNVHGGAGVTRLAGAGPMTVLGHGLTDAARELVPGFAPTGGPRPSQLQRR